MQRAVTSQVHLAVGLVGPGLVGKALLEQLKFQIPNLEKKGITLKVRGIMDAQQMLLASGETSGLDLASWKEDLVHNGTDASLGVLTEHLKASQAPNRLVVDCTASALLPRFYPKWLEQGIHVVTPNKRLNAGPLPLWRQVKELQARGCAHYMYEGTVGAGLPVVSTLKALLDGGDRVRRIEGVFSGTLSYVFNGLSPGDPFSEAVKAARLRGFTEPDPRDDLSGEDVARKVMTLARECGTLVPGVEAVDVESLVPPGLEGPDVPLDEFLASLARADAAMRDRMAEAARNDLALRHVGTYDAVEKTCRVGLRAFPRTHPFAQLRGTENIIQFTTQRYHDPCLTIRGPGAGPWNTAAGVFTDIVTLARYLGAHS